MIRYQMKPNLIKVSTIERVLKYDVKERINKRDYVPYITLLAFILFLGYRYYIKKSKDTKYKKKKVSFSSFEEN